MNSIGEEMARSSALFTGLSGTSSDGTSNVTDEARRSSIIFHIVSLCALQVIIAKAGTIGDFVLVTCMTSGIFLSICSYSSNQSRNCLTKIVNLFLMSRTGISFGWSPSRFDSACDVLISVSLHNGLST